METINCIKERRSIRKFKEQKVSNEIIDSIVDAASYAPSWKNTQTTRYTVISDPAVKEEIASECVLDFSYNTKTIVNAPQLVVASCVLGRSGFEKDGSFSTSKEDRWENFDAGIAVQTFCLAAHDMGVGTVILGIFDDGKVAKTIDLPEGEMVVALIPIGYPEGETPNAPKRKSTSELVRYR